jgi:site-specific DNA-methyltransferase (adenine-specific)
VKPYYQHAGITIYHGNALEILLDLPDQSHDTLLTDPPYSSGGQFRGDRIQSVHTKYVQSESESGHALGSFSGDNRDQRSFGYWVSLWANESRRVLRPGSIVACFTDWRQLPTMTDALQAGGIVWRGIVPWHKPNGRRTQGRWANDCEYVVWGTNGPRELEGRAPAGFYEVCSPAGEDRDHITQKPLDLIAALLRGLPGRTVLDPFMGSGTTLRAAKDLGLEATGIEIEEQYCESAALRMAQESLWVGPNEVAQQERLDLPEAMVPVPDVPGFAWNH